MSLFLCLSFGSFLQFIDNIIQQFSFQLGREEIIYDESRDAVFLILSILGILLCFFTPNCVEIALYMCKIRDIVKLTTCFDIFLRSVLNS